MATPQLPLRSPSMSPPLDLQTSYRLGAPLVYVKGELDHQTAPQLRAIMEITGLTDQPGFRALRDLAAAAAALGPSPKPN
jgi:hypothetical protein